MKLFVYEHITSGALADEELPASLAQEGDWMLNAIVQDLTDLAQFELVVMRDERLARLEAATELEYIWVETSADFERLWQHSLQQYDVFLIIAPETDNQLVRLQEAVLGAGKTYLGCDIETSRIASDKLHSYQTLVLHSINTPATENANAWLKNPNRENMRWVVKPVDGAGCLQTYVFEQLQNAEFFLIQLSDKIREGMIVQPYLDGLTVSLSLFVSEHDIQLLSVNHQHISSAQGQLHYSHSQVIDDAMLIPHKQVQQLALSIKNALPGLWGYVGVDLILQPDGNLVVIEINPRLTTSYVNLRQSLALNPAYWLAHFLDEKMNSAVLV